MNTKSKATVATLGLGALVLSGGTLALWQDQADLNNASINTGHLSIDALDVRYYDISDLKLQVDIGDSQPGHEPSPSGDGTKSLAELPNHEIDLGTYVATPGDTILVVQEIVPVLKGHNLLARVDVVDQNGTALGDNISYAYTGVPGDGAEAFSITEPLLFSAFDETTGDLTPVAPEVTAPSSAWLFTENDSSTSMWVAYKVTFSANDGPVGGDPTDAPEMDAIIGIQNLGVQMTQVLSENP